MKRFCQMLRLKENKDLIEEYTRVHANVWPEVQRGIKEVGILDMQIYVRDNLLFMIVDPIDGFDWERDMTRLSMLPRQAEWERFVAKFQDVEEGASSREKWTLMDKIFELVK